MLSTKDLVFKKQLAKKLVDWYVGPYIINEVVSTNTVKLWLPILMRLHLVVNINRVVCYKEQVKKQKIKEVKLVEIKGVFSFWNQQFITQGTVAVHAYRRLFMVDQP